MNPDWLLIGAIGCVLGSCGLLAWCLYELVTLMRWQRFLKLLDERLGDQADGSRLTPPDAFKVLHPSSIVPEAQRDHV